MIIALRRYINICIGFDAGLRHICPNYGDSTESEDYSFITLDEKIKN